MDWITLEHTDGHRSSLAVFPDHLRVTGVLSHCAEIRPASDNDAVALHRWVGRRLPMPTGWREREFFGQTIETIEGTVSVGINDQKRLFVRDARIVTPSSPDLAIEIGAETAHAIAYVVARWGA